jgi:6-phosphofructo-2-kinase / fructose-2,6-biphosphatase 2
VPNVIALVGLPARGKTYISHKLCRYLNWIGIKTRAFNVGEYRRQACDFEKEGLADFFDHSNERAVRIRDECARHAMEDMGRYLDNKEGEVAVFDATNTTRQRRQMLVDFCKSEERDPKFRIFFIESVCDDMEIIESNITVSAFKKEPSDDLRLCITTKTLYRFQIPDSIKSCLLKQFYKISNFTFFC